MKKQVLLEDTDDWARHRVTPDSVQQFVEPLRHIGGVDISFVKGDSVNACAAFVVLSLPDLEVEYKFGVIIHSWVCDIYTCISQNTSCVKHVKKCR